MINAPKGIIVPLITPFNDDETIDFQAYKKVIDFQIESGVHGLLVGGTTGEYHVMSLEERKSLIKAGCEYAAGRVPVMAGVGCFTAKETIELANYAAECGAKWGLVLPPYYHHTSEDGILEFFKEIAAKSKVGIVIYNYPEATNVCLSPEMIYELSQEENIVSVKESADFGHLCKVLTLTRDIDNFSVFTGEEHFMLPTFSIGGQGAFGILVNLLPKEVVKLYELAVEEKDIKAARDLNSKLSGFYDLMEAEGNPYPGPVKAGVDMIGLKGGKVRKPLTQTTAELKSKLKEQLIKLGYEVK
ncbi:4-hydroxy-tetrahydrodipicolinate synthase [Clostridium formicaceticum]|uniref:4-hydroxy-tetrahydrodipicolinate synthase n=1 Tax=Clostridium formicaceticum TaxID=1497 RepID=A0AAC9RP85_9CLOT|nr:4-hydroxy-tetrahydrodipicolinate synthase [Clostridium formicaceticum]AOY77861.1 4-hydroxy-tetrahydrodipicolinate synthase [Clostridium formicaceticum]ARE88478.1 4-hydroxy-tetrahydrodipicolinate synthase [Clostridium formicaceticum]